jgi:hypothetical protein
VRRCYDQVITLAPYRIEHVDIPWNGTLVSGNLHLCPNNALLTQLGAFGSNKLILLRIKMAIAP